MAILADPVRRATGARPARRGVNYGLLGLAFVGLAIAKLLTVYYEMTARIHKTSFAHEGCTHYDSMMSPRDIVPVFEGVYVASSAAGRTHTSESFGVDASPPGELFAMWNVDTPGKGPSMATLPLAGSPPDIAFHPHGMHFRRETEELFVINHAYSEGGQRIDVFKVEETYPQDPLPEIYPSLKEGTPVREAAEEENSEEGSAKPSGHFFSGADAPVSPSTDGAEDSAGQKAGDVVVAKGSDGEATADDDGTADEGRHEDVPTVAEVTESLVEGQEARMDERESPKERAKRLKREAKEEAARERTLMKEIQAAERAQKKAAAARMAARKKGVSTGSVPVKLTYSFSVEHEYITENWGVLGDLILVDDDELYVTQNLPTRFGLPGPTDSSDVLSAIRRNVAMLVMFLHLSRAPIIRCTGIRGENIKCERLAKGRGVMYNGIALSPDKERLIVSDTMAMQMVVFNRALDTGELTVRQRLDVPGSPNKLEIDLYRAATGIEAYTVGLVHMWHFVKFQVLMVAAKDASAGDQARCAGGVTSVVYDKESGKYSETLEMWHNDSMLQTSSAVATTSDSRLVGSAMKEGLLLCRPPPCTPIEDGRGEHCGWGVPESLSEEDDGKK